MKRLLFCSLFLIAPGAYGQSLPETNAIEEPALTGAESCQSLLEDYRALLNDPSSILSAELATEIARILNDGRSCDARAARIGALLERFYASDPWCARERAALTDLLNQYAGALIPTAAHEVLQELLADSEMPCREIVSAAGTIALHYDRNFLGDAQGGAAAEYSTPKTALEAAVAKSQRRAHKKRVKRACRNMNRRR